jgi:signal transduction histidine kinase
MRRFATVRVRVTIAAVAVVGAALAAGGTLLVRAHNQSLTTNVEHAALLRSRDIAAEVARGSVTPASLALPIGDESLVQVVDANGMVAAASPNIAGEARISTLDPGAGGYAARTVRRLPIGDARFRVVARRVVTDRGTFTVYVAGSLEPVAESTRSLAGLLFLGLPALLLVVGVTTWVVTGRALQPVEAIRREVEAIGAERLHRRVPEPGTADEIGRLARTMNAMLARLEEARDRQRRFVADASHELRTPLTGIRARIEVDLAHPDAADWQGTEREVLDDAIGLQRLVDDLLVLAAADASAADPTLREPVDFDEIVLREARRLRSRTSHRVDTSGVSGAQLVGNPADLTRAVRNLLDNADRHARSAVTVALAETSTELTLTISDDGPGIPEDRKQWIFERFTRLDDARARDTGGTGLGLAITHDVVTAHGGTIVVDNTPGAQFTIELPLP